MEKTEAVSQAIAESRANGGDRRYAVYWSPNPNFPKGHWTIETRKPCLAGACLMVADGKLKHA